MDRIFAAISSHSLLHHNPPKTMTVLSLPIRPESGSVSPLGDHSPKDDSFSFAKFVPLKPSNATLAALLLDHEESKVGLAHLPAERQKMCRRKGAKLSMILAGCTGAGKSTFLNTLFGEVLDVPQKDDPPVLYEIRERKFQLLESDFELELTAVDVPGFGAKMDNQYSWMPIVKYIDHYFRRYMLQEEQPDRKLLEDNRVHICLYFIQPSNTHLSALDIESMKEISKRVNMIPIVARSDTLNKDELVEFKKTINQTLAAYDIGICKFVSDPEVLAKIHKVAPYAVVGSNATFVNKEGQRVRARKYHWGMVEIENPDHCDFLALREILMSEHMLDLIQSTEAHYNAYRTWCLKERVERASNKMSGESAQLDESEDGLVSYALYKGALPWNSFVLQEDMELEDAQLKNEARKILEEEMRKQELNIRNQKNALHKQQVAYNEELKSLHKRVIDLKEETRRLTSGEANSGDSDSFQMTPPLKDEYLGD